MFDQITVQINGLTYSCVNSIEQKLSETKGIKSIKVSLANKSAEVEYNRDVISDSALMEKIEEMGFEASIASNSEYIRSALFVKEMKSDTCSHKIESRFINCPGVKTVKACLQDQMVRIIHNSSEIVISEISKIISDLGFSFEFVPLLDFSNCLIKILVEGMTCQSCVNNIEEFIGQKLGIKKISVSLKDKLASIWFDSTVIKPEDLRTSIEDMGFDATINEISDIKSVKSSCFCIQSLGISDWCSEDEDVLFFNKGIISITSASRSSAIVVYYLPDVVGVNDIINVIQSMGYICSESSSEILIENSKSLPNRQEQIVIDEKIEDKMKKKKSEVFLDIEDDLEKCFLRVNGMTCASCVAAIERNVMKIEGVHRILVALMAQKAEVKYDPAYILPSQIAAAISELGYTSTVLDDDSTEYGELNLHVNVCNIFFVV